MIEQLRREFCETIKTPSKLKKIDYICNIIKHNDILDDTIITTSIKMNDSDSGYQFLMYVIENMDTNDHQTVRALSINNILNRYRHMSGHKKGQDKNRNVKLVHCMLNGIIDRNLYYNNFQTIHDFIIDHLYIFCMESNSYIDVVYDMLLFMHESNPTINMAEQIEYILSEMMTIWIRCGLIDNIIKF
jgi:hypothetical protein